MTEPDAKIKNTTTQSSAIKKAAIAGIGAALVVIILSLANQLTAPLSWLMAPFGASLVILFALPASPLAQPRNVIGGHLLTTLIGLTIMSVFGVSAWSMALAVGLALSLMMLTDTLHPPAGANPLLVMMTAETWPFLFNPVLPGACMMVILALIYHRLNKTPYPQRWF